MSEPTRKIIHCDCDCFYAAVEMRDDPRLRGRPLAVGGRAETRGVIATCNYEARAFGVHSAMPTARALQLCPQLVLLAPDFERYREASRDPGDLPRLHGAGRAAVARRGLPRRERRRSLSWLGLADGAGDPRPHP
jgi:Nucleotidyltransferase/DNA polymerase involved in DNA repair